MANFSPKWSSADLVKTLLPSLQQVASLMSAGVFLAIGSESGEKLIYSSGYLKDVFEQGDMKPSTSDIDLTGNEEVPVRKENFNEASVVGNSFHSSLGRQHQRREEESPRESRESRNLTRKSFEVSGRTRSRSRHRSPLRKPLDVQSETKSRSRHRSPLRHSSDNHDR